MKAICIEQTDDTPTILLRNVECPAPGPDELLVRVYGAGVNFADLTRAAKHFGADGDPTDAIAGLEMAGEVVSTGEDVHGIEAGTRVMGLTSGTYAEYCLIHQSLAMRIPGGMSYHEAAATAATFMTAHDALISNGEMRDGEMVLIQAASSGVGIAATQLARFFGAGKVIGTSTSPAKLDRLSGLGLEVGINSKSENFVDVVFKATTDHGADVIIENIGGDTLPGDVRCAAVGSRIINVGRLGNWTGEINLDEHSRKRIKLIGVTFRTRTVKEHAEVARRAGKALFPAFESGKLKPIVDRVFPLDEAAQAQDYMKSGKHFGKIVLQVG